MNPKLNWWNRSFTKFVVAMQAVDCSSLQKNIFCIGTMHYTDFENRIYIVICRVVHVGTGLIGLVIGHMIGHGLEVLEH